MTDQEKILRKLLAERILLLDGAMGTMIQQHKLNEEDYRGGAKDRKSTRLNSSHSQQSRMPSSA